MDLSCLFFFLSNLYGLLRYRRPGTDLFFPSSCPDQGPFFHLVVSLDLFILFLLVSLLAGPLFCSWSSCCNALKPFWYSACCRSKLSLPSHTAWVLLMECMHSVCLYAVLMKKGLQSPRETQAGIPTTEVLSWRGDLVIHLKFVLT